MERHAGDGEAGTAGHHNGRRGAESSTELLARARNGDGAAADALLARYLPPLRRWASGRLPRAARQLIDTDDLLQDTLLGTFRRLGEFEPQHEGAFLAYLRQAALNRIRKEIGRIGASPSRALSGPREPPDSDHPSPLDELVGRELVERYEAALGRLRPSEREAVVLRVELTKSYGEIAEATGRPSPDAARMAVGRALARLAEELDRGG